MEGTASFDRHREAEMKLRILIIVCLLSSVTFADKPNTTPEQQEAAKIEQLKQKIEHDSERDICYNSAELVRDLVEQFNNQMNAGELKPAQQTLNDIGTYAEKARDAAKKSHHKLKQAELTLHKSARRLSDIAQALSVEDRDAIDKVVKKIEAADDDILNQVFKN
jgi:alkyl sulfatase BDS1-like metallo-beta-lactamase superfamily hydrolase